MKKLLIATTSEGKYKEIANELTDLPFVIVSLKDLKKTYQEPEENSDTLEGNAILKAKFYASKTGLLTLADDTGIFINALSGWPGVKSARVASKDLRVTAVLQRMKNIKNRTAIFKTVLALYDPPEKSLHTSYGEVKGRLLKTPVSNPQINLGYDPIFYVDQFKKTLSEATIGEKNLVSHRGAATIKMKYHLASRYSFKQFLVPVGIIVKDRKMLLTKRRDFRKDYNGKWEFPGGGVDSGETICQNLIREVKEETGYVVDIIEQLPQIKSQVRKKYGYQVFLLPYICKIRSGHFNVASNETSDHGWFTIKAANKKDLLSLNKKVIQDKQNLAILKKYIEF